MDYLQATIDEHLVVLIEKVINLSKWHIGASFVVHDDFRSHTGGIFTMSTKCGPLNTASLEQKLNSLSSTEAELIVVDDNVGKILWKMEFLYEQ